MNGGLFGMSTVAISVYTQQAELHTTLPLNGFSTTHQLYDESQTTQDRDGSTATVICNFKKNSLSHVGKSW